VTVRRFVEEQSAEMTVEVVKHNVTGVVTLPLVGRCVVFQKFRLLYTLLDTAFRHLKMHINPEELPPVQQTSPNKYLEPILLCEQFAPDPQLTYKSQKMFLCLFSLADVILDLLRVPHHS